MDTGLFNKGFKISEGEGGGVRVVGKKSGQTI